MDLGFCFQDLGDGGDSFVKSFIEPAGHAYQDAMLEDLSSATSLGSSGSFYGEGGWDDAASFVQSYSGAAPYAGTHHSVASASSSPSHSSPSSLMTLADYEEGAALMGAGVSLPNVGGLAPPLSLSYFDLQAGMEMPDAPLSLGLYGLGNFFGSPATLTDTHPPRRAVACASSSGPLLAVKLEPQQQHHHHHQQQLQHHHHQASSMPAKVGAGVPGVWSAHDEPLKRKRKLGPGGRHGPNPGGGSYPAAGGMSTGKDHTPPPSAQSRGKQADPCELPLHAVDLAGALVGHRGGLTVKQEERGEGSGKPHHLHLLHSSQSRQSEPVELVVERQPPVEVRTRTPSENRNFGVTVRVTGRHDALHIQSVENQQILGGKKTVPLKEDGRATFDNLSMREASTKHGEREFCLEFVPLTKDGQPLGSFGTRTSPFYAYSHMKVLARRKSVKLRTLNKNHGSVHGGDKMHVIGQPFIKGPSLSIIFSTPHGDVTALNPEMYSDSVLFFEAPPYPCPAIFSPYNREPVREVKVMVQVTNDGRTMSNPLEFTYIADKPVHRADF